MLCFVSERLKELVGLAVQGARRLDVPMASARFSLRRGSCTWMPWEVEKMKCDLTEADKETAFRQAGNCRIQASEWDERKRLRADAIHGWQLDGSCAA